jgi:hypothetical protein
VRRCPLAAGLAVLALTGAAASASDGLWLAAAGAPLARAQQASAQAEASGRSPAAVQAAYDAARELAEALRRAGPPSASCAPLAATLGRATRGLIAAQEGVDQLSPARHAAGLATARSAAASIPTARAACQPAATTPPRVVAQLDEPRSGEVFYGAFRALAPPGATSASVALAGRSSQAVQLGAGSAAGVVVAPAGRYADITLVFYRGTQPIAARRSTGVWLLPRSAQSPAEGAWRVDAAGSAQLAGLAHSFAGYAALLAYDPLRGRVAAYDQDALFPAASTVKLGVLVAAARRFGPDPDTSPAGYDLTQLAGWSSNLATNRLLELLGAGDTSAGARLAQATLARMAATHSTFPGGYIVGTRQISVESVRPSLYAGARTREAGPPLVSPRVTSASDLAHVLATLTAAAAGDRAALRASGLSLHEARLVLGWLCASRPSGENLGLLREAVPRQLVMAQKQGWLADARHTAAVVFTPTGPRVVVILTYRAGETREQAAALGARLASFALAW